MHVTFSVGNITMWTCCLLTWGLQHAAHKFLLYASPATPQSYSNCTVQCVPDKHNNLIYLNNIRHWHEDSKRSAIPTLEGANVQHTLTDRENKAITF